MELASHEANCCYAKRSNMVLPVVHTARLLSSPFDLLSVFSPSSIRARIYYWLDTIPLGFFSDFSSFLLFPRPNTPTAFIYRPSRGSLHSCLLLTSALRIHGGPPCFYIVYPHHDSFLCRSGAPISWAAWGTRTRERAGNRSIHMGLLGGVFSFLTPSLQ